MSIERVTAPAVPQTVVFQTPVQTTAPAAAPSDSAAAAQATSVPAQEDVTTSAQGSAITSLSFADASTGTPPLDLAKFLKGFVAGNALDINGPGWVNGSGKIKSLDADTLSLTFDVTSLGKGSLILKRTSGNKFDMTVDNGDKTFTMHFKQSKVGNEVVFTDLSNPKKKLYFTNAGGTFNINPSGMSLPGSFDVSKK